MLSSIGEKVAVLREKRGWTLKELSRVSGVSVSHISAIENETRPNPSIQNIIKLARALEVSLSYFDDATTATDTDHAADTSHTSLLQKLEDLYDEKTQAFIVSEQSGPYVALAMELAHHAATQDPSHVLQLIAQFMRDQQQDY